MAEFWGGFYLFQNGRLSVDCGRDAVHQKMTALIQEKWVLGGT